MRGSSRRAQPSRCLPAREKQLHGSLQTARWDAVSPDATRPREAREKTRATCSRRDFTTRLRGRPRSVCSTVSDTSATQTDATTASAPTHLSERSRVASRNFFCARRRRGETTSRSTWVAAGASQRPSTLDPLDARRAASDRRPVFQPPIARPTRLTADRSLQSTSGGDSSGRSTQASSTPALARRHGTRLAESRPHW